MNENLSQLEEILGYSFKNKDLLLQAVTHSSYANEVFGDPARDNERLEFLGDAVLDLVVSIILFGEESNKAEGDLTKLRSLAVCEKSLADISIATGINEFLLLGRGEERGNGRERSSIAADCVESIIGAVYIDGGFPAAMHTVKILFTDTIEKARKGVLQRDSKTELQELLQKDGPCRIEYMLTGESGPDHSKHFTMSVSANGKKIGTGAGASKKEAQMNAAKAALEELQKNAF